MIDHDRLFKELLTAFFTEFIELFLPELAEYLDPASIEFLDKELFAESIPGQRQEADLVIRVRFRDQGAFFLVHVEHQAQVQPAFGLRLFRYFARLHEKHEVPVYPIALFSSGSVRSQPDCYQVRFPDREVLRFQYRVIQLSRMRWQDFLNCHNPAAVALMTRMGMEAEERPRVKLECLRLLANLRMEPRRARFLSGFIDTYLRLDRGETLQFEAQADSLLNRSERKKVMELTTSWKEEGLQQGLQQGREEGRQKGRQEGREEGRHEGREEGREEGRQEAKLELVIRLLRRRCGRVSRAAESQVRALSGRQLESLAEALLDFSSPDQLDCWLRSRLR